MKAVLSERGSSAPIIDINASDSDLAQRLRFPGSPTIRVDGLDVEPGFADPDDYTPRCRIYFTGRGMSGIPERSWIDIALDRAQTD